MTHLGSFADAIARAARALFLIGLLQTCLVTRSPAQVSPMIGRWNVELTFANGESRSLQFDAGSGGKGTLILLDPRAKAWGPEKPSQAEWTQEKENSVTFSGPIEFPLGNVGRLPGRLVFKGQLETESSITGEVDFSSLTTEQPAKHGTFKATRAAGR